ncbi:MAG TPA: PPC domain-containing protein [Polyangiales bacterium]|nr:PPC domain-containing protein [Polyangiales bacterium]
MLATGIALWLSGCGGSSRPAPVTPDDVPREHEAPESAAFEAVHPSTDAQAIQIDCDNPRFEECNALDDDCNGVNDDECGYEGGDVQITVSWNSGADIDLYVTDPSGATIYYNKKHNRSSIGGHLDHDARGDCRKEQREPRVENAYWPSPSRPGNYKVALHYFSPCGRAGPTDVTLSVVVEHQQLGAYRFQLQPEQKIDALSFVKR